MNFHGINQILKSERFHCRFVTKERKHQNKKKRLFYASSITIINTECEIGELNSNTGIVCQVHFCTNALGKRNQFIFSLPQLSVKQKCRFGSLALVGSYSEKNFEFKIIQKAITPFLRDETSQASC